MNKQGIPNPNAQLTLSCTYATTMIDRLIPADKLKNHQLKNDPLEITSFVSPESNWSAPNA